jgi:hypothetical protein
MTILAGDIKLVASQVMDDVPEGGGAPTATVINDGTSNAIFPDISEVDRAGGRVNARKVFVNVQTANVDGYFGTNVIVAEPPADPNVSVTLFSTGDVFDRRTDAKTRIESFLSVGAITNAYLFGDHIAGQRTVTLLGRTGIELPVVGASKVLRKNEGQASMVEQYVRITDVSSRARTFTADNNQEFTRLEITLGISDPLRADFPGFQAVFADAALNYTGKTKVYDTIVADAAEYFGVVPLTAPVEIGDFVANGESIYTQLVPSAQIETPIADARLNQQSAALVQSGDQVSVTETRTFTTTAAWFVGGGVLPGSLRASRAGGLAIIDRGGVLLAEADSAQVGTIDYGNGVLTLATNYFGTGADATTVVYKPADQPTVVNQSIGVPITQQSQGLTYVVTLDPAPNRASVAVSYRSGGRWYVLTEDGSGAVRGSDSAFGAGSLNFSTGTLTLTLGALPDVGSKVIVQWTSAAAVPPASTIPVQASPLTNRFFAAVELGSAIKHGTVSVSWNDGTARTATDNNGGLQGDAAGEVLYGQGIVRISPNVLPAKGTVFTVSITDTVRSSVSVANFTDSGANWTFSLGGAVKARSVELGVAAQHAVREFPGIDTTKTRLLKVFDDGTGNLVVANVTGNLAVGAVNYTTGDCSLAKSVAGFKDVQNVWENRTPLGGVQTVLLTGAETRSLPLTLLNGVGGANPDLPVWVWWSGQLANAAEARYSGADGTGASTQFSLNQINARGRIARFKLGADQYVLKSQTAVEVNPSSATGIGTVVGGRSSAGDRVIGTPGDLFGFGFIDRNGYTYLSEWPAGVSAIYTKAEGVVHPALGAGTTLAVDVAVFRSAVAPLRNGSFSIAGTWLDGTTFTATADANGVLATGSAPANADTYGSLGVFGIVDYDSGVVEVRFGRRAGANLAAATGVIDISGLGLAGVSLFQSAGVRADTLRYNASAFTYLPLDADLLGIDPVRLPNDGRVPIFRAGSFAVLGHTKTTGPVAVSNGQTINLARVRLSRVRVIGNNGQVINTGYSTNLEAGTVTFNDVSGYSQPVTIEDRIEDMMLVRDAQINGQLTFTRPVTHDYPLGSYISSALVAGDLRSRVSLMFDQATWDGSWKDAISGNPATGTYNDVLAPVEVTNLGAVTERWLVRFTNTTTFEVIGEHVGVIGTGNTATDFAINNPATGTPYFTLRALGWGGGWSAGNVLRFNTVGALFPVWVVRTIQQGPETVTNDRFTLLVRGDVNNNP